MWGLGSSLTLLVGDSQADQIVPPTGFTARLTLFMAAAMAFLTVFALALSLASARLSARWGEELARSSTIRISAPVDQLSAQTAAALRVLATTQGVASARALTPAEQQALLEPWFGPDVPVDALPVPQLIEVIEKPEGYDVTGLRLRLSAEVAGAVLDDHTRWRRPLVRAAASLRLLAWVSIGLIAGLMVAMITLAANAALAANAQVIAVLRLVGATDLYIIGSFVRRFTKRALIGAFMGTVLAVLALIFLPSSGQENGFLTGLGFQGLHWVLPAMVPVLAASVAFFATWAAADRTLLRLS